jgi:formate dehydrogenase major subunit
MTNGWTDLENSDVILVLGANPAENHPAAVRHITNAREKGAKLIVVDPRYTRTAAIADYYAPIRSGADVAFMGGLMNYFIENNLYNEDYVVNCTNASWLINPEFGFDDGLFTGFEETQPNGQGKYDKTTWSYQVEETTEWDTADGAPYAWAIKPGVPKFDLPVVPVVKKDKTLKDPNCVFQLLKKHYERYTPEKVSAVAGIPQKDFEEIASIIASTAADDKAGTILYAMGLTQHTNGSQIVRAAAMYQLLLGNIGNAGGGVNALRGESNVQGACDWGILYHVINGYLAAPNADNHPTLADYNAKETTYAGYWSNKPKFIISQLKEYWGDNATLDNDFGYDWLPKIESKNYSYMPLFEAMHEGTINGLFCWGQNPLVGGPNVNFALEAMRKLDWFVAIDLMETDSMTFWEPGMGWADEMDAAKIQTEVFSLPACSHLEKQGSITNSGRWIQWRYNAVEPMAEALDDGEIVNRLYQAVKKLYDAEGGANPDPITKLYWPYTDDHGHFDAVKSARACNGYNWETKAPLVNFTTLQADGTTACAGWIYAGYFNNPDSDNPADQPTGKRDNSDATVSGLEGGLKQYPDWSFAWPLNRRVVYNRASTFFDSGKARNPEKILVQWNESKGNWDRNDVPDFGFQTAVMDPATGVQAVDADGKPVFNGNPPEKCPSFFMVGELVARLYAPGMADGPFPEHYEPAEGPVKNAFSSVQVDPVALLLDSSNFGTADQYPLICTTYRLVEHWQTGVTTRNSPWLAEAMPHNFIEMSEELAAERGIAHGDMCELFNNRGVCTARAMVTKRIEPFTIDGKTVHQVGIPWHWGRKGIAAGATANELVPNAGDANVQIPESKAFLVDIRKAR